MEERYLDPEIERLTEFYEKDPTGRVFAPLADAYRKSKLYDEAIDILKKGLEIHPAYVSAHLVLARCYYDKDMLQLAKGSLERVLELDQQNVIALRLLGDILYRLGDEAGALARYRNVLEIDPANLEVQALMDKITPAAAAPREIAPRQPERAATGSFFEKEEADSQVFETPPRIGQLQDDEPLKERRSSEAVQSEATTESDESKETTEKGFATATLAEIYEEQGFLEKALDVYQQLLKAHPDDQEIATRVADLTAKLKPPVENQITQTQETFSGLLGRERAENKEEAKEEEEKKGDFGAFKQWLEGLSKNEEAE